MALHLHTFSAGSDNPALRTAPELRGAMAKFAEYYMANAYLPRRDWAYVAAIALSSVLTSRYYNFGGQYSSIYLALGADSGTGKNTFNSVFYDLMLQIDKDHARELISKISDVSSGAAVHAHIANNPQNLGTIDEWGKMLSNMRNNTMAATAQSVFTCAYTDTSGYLAPKSYADLRPNDANSPKTAVVDRPALSLICFGTPERIRQNIDEEEYIDGSYARYSMIELTDTIVRPNEFPAKKPLNDEILALIRSILLFKSTGFNVNSEVSRFKLQRGIPAPFDLILEKGDIDLADLYVDIQTEIKTNKTITKARAAMMRRRIEIAKRLAIPIALLGYAAKKEGMFERFTVSQDAMQDALDLAECFENASYSFIFGAPTFKDSVIKCGDAMIELLKSIMQEKVFTSLSKVRKATGCPWTYKDDKELIRYLSENGYSCESKFTKNTLFICEEKNAGKKGIDLAIAQIRLLRAAHPDMTNQTMFKLCECDKKTYNAAWDAVSEYEKCDALENAKTSIFYLDATIDTKATSS